MVAVGGGVMTGHGQGHFQPAVMLRELSRLYAGEIVGLVLIAVDAEVVKGHPGQAGHRIGVLRRKLRLAQNAVPASEPLLIVQIPAVKDEKILVELRPHQGDGVILRVHGGIEGSEGIIIAQLPIPQGAFEFRLPVQIPGDQPQVCREKPESGLLHSAVQTCDIHLHRQEVPRRRHLGKIAEHLAPVPGLQINGCKHAPSFLSEFIVPARTENVYLRIVEPQRRQKGWREVCWFLWIIHIYPGRNPPLFS